MVREDRMADILRKVEAENPDIVVSTGDLVDGNMDGIDALPALFGKFQPRLGKYAITGNHEVYAGLAESLVAEKAFGFTVLSGQMKTVDNILNIAGIDDPATGLPEDEKAILEKAQNGLFTLFLKHRPGPAQRKSGSFRPTAIRAHALRAVVSIPLHLQLRLPASKRAVLSSERLDTLHQQRFRHVGSAYTRSGPP